jgi:hypothetical protein
LPDTENILQKKVAPTPALREVYILPADPEPAWVLTQTEYGILLQGEPVPAEDNIRWGAFGAFATAVGTLIGLYFTIRPAEIMKKGEVWPIAAYFGLISFSVVMLVLFIMAALRLRQLRPKPDSPYARVKSRIEAHYKRTAAGARQP